MRVMGLRIIAFVSPLVLTALARPSLAQTEVELAQRRGLLEQAQRERMEQDHAAALRMAEAAGRIQMTPSVRLFIAEEQSALGHVSDALASARRCVQETTAAEASLRNREAILARCNGLVAELQARPGSLMLRVPPQPPSGLRVTLNGVPVEPARFSRAISAGPGTVAVHAEAPGREPRSWNVTVAPGTELRLDVVLETACSGGAACGEPDGNASRVADSGGGIPTGGVVAAAGGALVLGASVLFFVLRDQAAGELRAGYCQPAGSDGAVHCIDSPASRSLLSTAHTYDLLADVALGVGSAAVVAGAAWMLFGRGGGSHEHAAVRVLPTREGAVLTLEGMF